jgi:hypothetical protein
LQQFTAPGEQCGGIFAAALLVRGSSIMNIINATRKFLAYAFAVSTVSARSRSILEFERQY